MWMRGLGVDIEKDLKKVERLCPPNDQSNKAKQSKNDQIKVCMSFLFCGLDYLSLSTTCILPFHFSSHSLSLDFGPSTPSYFPTQLRDWGIQSTLFIIPS